MNVLAFIYPFDTTFMVRALIACMILGACAPLIGTFVVQKKLSLVGDGLGHVAAAGVGIALWANIAPQAIAIIATVIAAVTIEWIFHSSKSSDTALALIFYSGIAASITFAGKSPNQARLQQYLFGSILSSTTKEIITMSIVCIFALLIVIIFYRYLVAIAIDEDSTAIAGIKIHLLHILLMVSVALIVSISMTITGLLLVSAVMVIPVMSSKSFSNSFFKTWIYAGILGVIGSVIGLAFSRFINLAPGGTIVLTHVVIYIFVQMLVRIMHNVGSNSSR